VRFPAHQGQHRRRPPDTIHGFLGVYFTALFVVIAISQIVHGLDEAKVWKLAAWVVPVCLGGWLAGKRFTAKLVSGALHAACIHAPVLHGAVPVFTRRPVCSFLHEASALK